MDRIINSITARASIKIFVRVAMGRVNTCVYIIPFLLKNYKFRNFSTPFFCALIMHEKFAAFYKCTEECFRLVPNNKAVIMFMLDRYISAWLGNEQRL
jgi:hypothetical protein